MGRKLGLVALLVVPLLGCALWAAAHIRLDRYTRLSPLMPTNSKAILSASSPDGLHFTVDARPLVATGVASQSHTLHPSGRTVIVATDPTGLMGRHRAKPSAVPRVSTLFEVDAESGARTALFLDPCTNAAGDRGQNPVQCVDPDIVALPDGRVRLYFLRIVGKGDPAFTENPNEFRSALLGPGGRWQLEPGVRMQAVGAADPDVVKLHDGRFRMYYTRGNAKGPRDKLISPGIFSAVSDDGMVFRPESGTRVHFCSASDTVRLEDGGYRMYCHRRDIFSLGPHADPTAYIVSFLSLDGLTFTQEAGVRLGAVPVEGSRDIGSAAPSIDRMTDGSFRMLFTTVREPLFPSNYLFFRENARHFERTVEATERRPPKGGPLPH